MTRSASINYLGLLLAADGANLRQHLKSASKTVTGLIDIATHGVKALAAGTRAASDFSEKWVLASDVYADSARNIQKSRLSSPARVTDETVLPELKATALSQANQNDLLTKKFEQSETGLGETDAGHGRTKAGPGKAVWRAFELYVGDAKKESEEIDKTFSRAFGVMEDALHKLATTGKVDFKSMTESIISDLTRIAIRAGLIGLLGGGRNGERGGLMGLLFSPEGKDEKSIKEDSLLSPSNAKVQKKSLSEQPNLGGDAMGGSDYQEPSGLGAAVWRGFDLYLGDAKKESEEVDKTYSRVFKSMEDALHQFATTGKVDFKSLADSIVSDLLRIQIRAGLIELLGGGRGGERGGLIGLLLNGVGQLMGGTGAKTYPVSGGNPVVGVDLPMLAGARARGGDVAVGHMYEVNEGGDPELLNIGQRQYLMLGKESGDVQPLGNWAAKAQHAGSRISAESTGNVRVDVEIINQGQPLQAQALAERQPDGRVLVKMLLKEWAEDMAGGGITARATKQRFNLLEA